MQSNINKVYVNPNFNRVASRKFCISDPTYSKNLFHVNPNFTRDMPIAQKNTNLKRKIYVNPNFIKTTNVLESNKLNKTELITHPSKNVDYLNSLVKEYSPSFQCQTENSELSENIPAITCSKSRYRLIRRNDNIILAKNPIKESCMIKINKYKSMHFNNFKNSLQIAKSETTSNSKINRSSKPLYINGDCYKLVRHNSRQNINTNKTELPLKYNSLKNKRIRDLKFQLQLKVSNDVTKKNNIPCRLFTKYGKCLRNVYGTCTYLHDKKHVALCRKFIKGICHDKACLLSHELSSKKMPTCFFYLKGNCMKDDCPYVHVKLSEKSNICRDFLKGYCDKGDTCLHRHLRVRPQKGNNNNKLYSLSRNISYRNIKINISKSVKGNQLRSVCLQTKRKKIDSSNKSNSNHCQNENDGECRYFNDFQNNDDSTCDVLKPTRCKLGALPSFIHL